MCPTTEWRGTGCPLHEGGGGVANRAFANGYPNDLRAASINANAPRASILPRPIHSHTRNNVTVKTKLWCAQAKRSEDLVYASEAKAKTNAKTKAKLLHASEAKTKLWCMQAKRKRKRTRKRKRKRNFCMQAKRKRSFGVCKRSENEKRTWKAWLRSAGGFSSVGGFSSAFWRRPKMSSSARGGRLLCRKIGFISHLPHNPQ
ncbi:MAG: hypothetical protein GY820_17755 [Gammaproteobacteria bacterium]|nr:hypothetical protein [Gammaproteobacteria bacterium]